MVAGGASVIDVPHAVAGLTVGLLVGLTGVGGGSLMTPLLVLLFGVSPATAVGTDLLYASLTKIAGSFVHGWRATVDWAITRRLASGSIPATLVTLAVLSRTGPPGARTSTLILLVLAGLLALTALTVVSRPALRRFALWREARGPQTGAPPLIATVVLGAVIGLAVSVSSVGAGAIGVSILLVLYPHAPLVRLVGSDIAHAVPLALLAGAGHWLIGDVDPALLLVLLAGSIPGVVVGSLLSTRAPEGLLRPLLALVLALSSWQLAVKALTPAHGPDHAAHKALPAEEHPR